MTKEEKQEEIRIRILAIRSWNHGESVPMKDRDAVLQYINLHPEIFKVAGPQ